MDTNTAERFEQVIREDGRYPPEAYEFLYRALEHTTRAVHGDPSSDEPRHVSGRQLCEGARVLAVEQWGALAPLVLRRWNIRGTRDFGEMVFLLVENGFMGRQDTDRIEDFDDVYDFHEAFGRYEIDLERNEM